MKLEFGHRLGEQAIYERQKRLHLLIFLSKMSNYLGTSFDAYCQEKETFLYFNDFFAAWILFPSGSPPEPFDLLNEQSKWVALSMPMSSDAVSTN